MALKELRIVIDDTLWDDKDEKKMMNCLDQAVKNIGKKYPVSLEEFRDDALDCHKCGHVMEFLGNRPLEGEKGHSDIFHCINCKDLRIFDENGDIMVVSFRYVRSSELR